MGSMQQSSSLPPPPGKVSPWDWNWLICHVEKSTTGLAKRTPWRGQILESTKGDIGKGMSGLFKDLRPGRCHLPSQPDGPK